MVLAIPRLDVLCMESSEVKKETGEFQKVYFELIYRIIFLSYFCMWIPSDLKGISSSTEKEIFPLSLC